MIRIAASALAVLLATASMARTAEGFSLSAPVKFFAAHHHCLQVASRIRSTSTLLQYANGPSSKSASAGDREFAKRLNSILSNRQKQRTAAEDAEKYLFDAIDAGKVRPDVVSFTKIISAWARSRDRSQGAAHRARALMDRMDAIADKEGREEVRPNLYSYNACLNAYARRGMVSEAEELFEEIQALPRLEADTWTYNSLINAHASSRRNKKGGAEKAAALLEQMKDGASDSVKPDSVTYSSVIKCLAKAGGKDNATRATALLDELEELYEKTGDKQLESNTIVYNIVLDAWANIRGGIDRAEAIFNRMESKRAAADAAGLEPNVSPDAFTFSSLIKALTVGGRDEDRQGRTGAERAEQLLDRMERLYRAGDETLRPNNVVYNAVIHACARSGQVGSAQRAEDLLGRLQELHRQSVEEGVGKAESDSLRADTISFNSVIDAWARAEEYGSAERCESLLDSMERQCIAGNEHVKPDAKTFNSCINAWARTGGSGAGLRSEQLLDRMEALHEDTGDEDVRPNMITYASVINAHAKSHKKGCGEAAEAILDYMEEMYEDGNKAARPNPIAFSSVCMAWENSGIGLAAPRAEGLLTRMMEYVDMNNTKDLANAHKTFDVVVRILSKTHDENTIHAIQRLRPDS